MTPYFEANGITLYHGDCREILPTLGPVDHVITDPPFGIGFDYGGYDDAAASYPSLMREWIAATECSGSFFVWQNMTTADRWHEWFPRGYRIFAACKGFVQFRPQPVQHSWDPVIFWGDVHGEPSVERKDWNIQWMAPFGAGRERSFHPCPRPIEQVAAVVEIASLPGETILDPFAGSGTSLVAAHRLGRNAIGVEISEEWCEGIAKRLEREMAQGRFDLAIPETVTQEVLL